VDFTTIGTKKVILHQDGISFLEKTNHHYFSFIIDFKKCRNSLIKFKTKLPSHADGYYELNYKISAQPNRILRNYKTSKIVLD
jgi:hypothetical protein